MRLAKITLAVLSMAIITGFTVLIMNSGVAGQQVDFKLNKLQSTEAKLKDINFKYEQLNSELKQQSSNDKKKIEDLKKQQEQLQKEREDLLKQVQAKAEEKRRLAEAAANAINTATGTATAHAAPAYSGSHQDWMAAAGIAPSDYSYVEYIVSHESSWNYTARNKSSGAYGLCQALPATKMANAGADWETNPVTQLRWCAMYAANAHGGGWYNNYVFWVNNHWW